MSISLLFLNVLSLILMTISLVGIFQYTKNNKMAQSFCICEILVINWIICHMLDMFSSSLSEKVIINNIGYISVCAIAPAFLLFSLYYAKSRLTESKIFKSLIFLPSLILYCLEITNPIFGLFFTRFSVSNVVGGFGFYATAALTYCVLILSLGITIKSNIKEFNQKKKQIFLISFAAIVPLIMNILSVADVLKIGYDFTPISFSLTSILVFIAVYKYEFISINPLAVEQLLSSMSEAVMIIDQNNRLTHLNHSCKSAFPFLNSEVGVSADILFNQLLAQVSKSSKSNFISMYHNKQENIVTLINLNDNRFFNVKKLIVNNKNKRIAQVYIFADMTEYYSFTKTLSDKNSQLQKANSKLKKMNYMESALAVEKERIRIAQELHDSLGHNLVSIMTLLKITTIKEQKQSCEVEEALHLSQNLLESVRECVSDMKDSLDISIVGRIKKLIESSEIIKNRVELSIIGSEEIIHNFAGDTVYSIVRESITNSLNHGEADKINIIIKFNSQNIRLYILDNGKGCEDICKGHGLLGMQNKVLNLSGQIEFNSLPNNGFTVKANIPLEEACCYENSNC